MKYFIIAGERSGDLHASNLIRALKAKDTNADIQGIGGELMENAGLKKVIDYSEISVMGFVEALLKIGLILKYLRICKEHIRSFNPDAVILVDFAGFNMRIARFAKYNGFRVFYYISPKIWAWNTGRAAKIKKWVDRMFVILPFEKEFYARFGMEVDYVGNPVLDAVASFKANPDFRSANHLTDKPIIAILPGSRKQEIEHMLHYMVSILPSFSQYQFVIAGLNTLPRSYYSLFIKHDRVNVVFDQTYDLLSIASAAIVTSGTATLETALFKVPQIVCYKSSLISYTIARAVIKVNYISLVNLIADRMVVKELIQDDFIPSAIIEELNKILKQDSYKDKIIRGYEQVKDILGEGGASDRTAEMVYQHLRKLMGD